MYYAQRLVNLADINVERTTEINEILLSTQILSRISIAQISGI